MIKTSRTRPVVWLSEREQQDDCDNDDDQNEYPDANQGYRYFGFFAARGGTAPS